MVQIVTHAEPNRLADFFRGKLMPSLTPSQLLFLLLLQDEFMGGPKGILTTEVPVCQNSDSISGELAGAKPLSFLYHQEQYLTGQESNRKNN